MIYLESPYLIIEGLTILRDHANMQQFHYFPNAPRLAQNPDASPSFLFLKYREDLSKLPEGAEPGGGLLTFDVDLRVDDDTLDTARRQIKRELKLEDEPLLAPLDYRRGRTRLVFLDFDDTDIGDSERQEEEPRFVVTADYAASPSLYGDNRATFSVQLSARGATLLEGNAGHTHLTDRRGLRSHFLGAQTRLQRQSQHRLGSGLFALGRKPKNGADLLPS